MLVLVSPENVLTYNQPFIFNFRLRNFNVLEFVFACGLTYLGGFVFCLPLPTISNNFLSCLHNLEEIKSSASLPFEQRTSTDLVIRCIIYLQR